MFSSIAGTSQRSDAANSQLREHDVPDRSKSDFYCEICDSHMNCVLMWESHVNGKRHLKNLKKDPQELNLFKKFEKKDCSESYLNRELVGIKEPVVGLDFICEIQQKDPVFTLTYRCYLCQCCCTTYDIVDHILTTKHRSFYLSQVDPASYKMIENLRLSQECLDSLIIQNVAELEHKNGRGKVEVKVETSRQGLQYPRGVKRSYEDEIDYPCKKIGAGQCEGKFQFLEFMENLPNMSERIKISVLRRMCTQEILAQHEKKTLLEIMESLVRALKRMPSQELTKSIREGIRKFQNIIEDRRCRLR